MRNKRRWIEWGKDALIVLLTLSAAYLLSVTPLVRDSGLLDLLAPQESPGAGARTAPRAPSTRSTIRPPAGRPSCAPTWRESSRG